MVKPRVGANDGEPRRARGPPRGPVVQTPGATNAAAVQVPCTFLAFTCSCTSLYLHAGFHGLRVLRVPLRASTDFWQVSFNFHTLPALHLQQLHVTLCAQGPTDARDRRIPRPLETEERST